MSNTDKAKAEAAKNYSVEQVAILKAAAPLDLEKAKEIAEQIGKSYRSIIAKCMSEKIEYVAKKPEPKRVNNVTKADMVKAIQSRLNDADLYGLEQATAKSLNQLAHALILCLPSAPSESIND